MLVNALPGPWFDLGSGLTGMFGVPQLDGAGSLVAGAPASLTLTSARPSALALLFASHTSIPTPFKGGTLLPAPMILPVALATSPVGTIPLGFPWPAGLPAGLSLDFQYAIADAAAPVGAALSNALRSVQP